MEVRFVWERMAEYKTKQLGRGLDIFFGNRHSGGIVTEYRNLHSDKNSDQDLRCCWSWRPRARSGAQEHCWKP